MHHPPCEAARAALTRLKTGNQRFVDNVRSIEPLVSHANRGALVGGQSPFAIVLACSDSRAPAEILFDCGLGDLFIVRIACNGVSPVVVGSVEFAAVTFGTPLVLVMGHSGCGAGGEASSSSAGAEKAVAPLPAPLSARALSVRPSASGSAAGAASAASCACEMRSPRT